MNEQELNELWEEGRKMSKAGTPATIAFILSILLMSSGLGVIIGIPLFLFASIYSAVKVAPMKKKLRTTFKASVVQKIFESKFEDPIYTPEMGMDRRYFESLDIMHTHDRFTTEDYLTANYKGVEFNRVDMHIEQRHSDGKGHTYYSTVYKGPFFTFYANKNFDKELILVERGFVNAKQKSSFFTKKTERRNKVEFEDEAFNKKFLSYAQSDQEAFYLMPPHVMQNLVNFTEAYKGRMVVGFVQGLICVGINNGVDAFEPKFGSRKAFDSSIAAIEDEVKMILDIIEVFKIDMNMKMERA